jgi:hypothetical protein
MRRGVACIPIPVSPIRATNVSRPSARWLTRQSNVSERIGTAGAEPYGPYAAAWLRGYREQAAARGKITKQGISCELKMM